MKLFVWDFHGVLETGTEQAVLDMSNQALADLGYPQRFSRELCDSLYGLKWFEYFPSLIPGLPQDAAFALQERCYAIHEADSTIATSHTRPTAYSHETLAAIQQAGHHQIILSNTQPEVMGQFLQTTGHFPYFPPDHILAINAHKTRGAATKPAALNRFLESHGPYQTLVLIGDRESDLSTADGLTPPVTRYLYAHPGRPFSQTSADHKIRDLRDVLREVL